MSIALIIPDRKLDALQAKLQQVLPEVPIEIWPAIAEPNAVKMAVLWRHPAGSLTPMTGLLALQSFGAGVDNILADPTLPPLPLARIVDHDLTQAMLQYLQGVVGYYRLRIDQYQRQQQQQQWKPRSPRALQTLCVLGLGQLGAATAVFFQQQGFAVSGWSATAKTLPGIDCYHGPEQFNTAVASADMVICLLPLTPATTGLLDQAAFAAFKTGAIFINVARGAIVDDVALLQQLDSGQLSAACLDVFSTEPLPSSHPFWQHPAVLITPHVSAVTNVETVVAQIAENYQRAVTGQPLLNPVQRERGY